MQPYSNKSGNAGVTEYEVGPDFILVRFRGGSVYRYSYAHAGRAHVDRMQELAAEGRGLSTYISQNVRDAFDRDY